MSDADELAVLRSAIDAYEKDAVHYRAEIERFKRGLRFYAEGNHFTNGGAFDSVSGEPENWLCDDRGSTVEDGTIAKRFLEGWDWNPDDDEQMQLPLEQAQP